MLRRMTHRIRDYLSTSSDEDISELEAQQKKLEQSVKELREKLQVLDESTQERFDEPDRDCGPSILH